MSTVTSGAAAESLAVSLLLRAGYRIIERNFRCRLGELDIIARDGATLCFIEVRSRADSTHGDAAEAVGPRKQARVTRVARVYLAQRAPRFEQSRFDVVAITGDRARLIRDAWRAAPD